MEIDRIIYKAKDGMIFYDPLECEEYEKTIGIIHGSVGELLSLLEKHAEPTDYLCGIIMVKDGEKTVSYCLCTVCVDDMLEDFVNVGELPDEKRYYICAVGGLITLLKMMNQDLPCQYIIFFSEYLDFRVFTSVYNCNQALNVKPDKDKKQ